MESKNPLEEIRNAILESQLLGVENDVTKLGVSEELMKICDALDNFYGIKRKDEQNTVEIMGGVYRIKPNPYISSIVGNPFGEEKFGKTTALLKEVKTSLKTMKEKLSIDDPVYLNLSSAIVSIALRNVVSSVNSYQKPAYYDYKRYDLISGVDKEFSNLVFGGLKVFNMLSDFDMSKECHDNYEANRKTILSLAESIKDAYLHPRSHLHSKSSSSGCIVLVLTLSTSIVACLCGILMILT
ncbi:MAG: hypothetical protein J6W19_05205 [Prevotella sp.]|nr:hypothetical protein [Prevotella sp.]